MATKGAKRAVKTGRKRRAQSGAKTAGTRTNRVVARTAGLTVTEVSKLKALRRELQRTAARRTPPRWNADPDEVRQSVAKLVLTLVEFIRKLLERQAIRRMDAGTLTDAQVEDIGRALMQLEQTVHDLAVTFGIPPDELNLDLGPVGKLM